MCALSDPVQGRLASRALYRERRVRPKASHGEIAWLVFRSERRAPRSEGGSPSKKLRRPPSEGHRSPSKLRRPSKKLHRPPSELHRSRKKLGRSRKKLHRPSSEAGFWPVRRRFRWWSRFSVTNGLRVSFSSGGSSLGSNRHRMVRFPQGIEPGLFVISRLTRCCRGPSARR
jgi:hypothetical protein